MFSFVANLAGLRSEVQGRVVDDLHDEEGAGLAHAGEHDQALAVQAVEVGDVAHADLEEIVEVAGDQVAVEHEGQGADRRLEGGEAVGGGAVEHHADQHQRAALDALGGDGGADRLDDA